MTQRVHRVTNRVLITYTRFVWAENRAQAEELAMDLGLPGAYDAVTETGWRAVRAKDGEIKGVEIGP